MGLPETIIPESLPGIDSEFDDFRQLALYADRYINDRVSEVEQQRRINEVADMLNSQSEVFLGQGVLMGGIIKKADFSKQTQPTLGGNRHLESGRVIGRFSGIVIMDLSSDFEDVKFKSTRQDDLMDTIEGHANGRYGVAYIVDLNDRMIRSNDFLQRSQETKSAAGLVTTATITLEDLDASDHGEREIGYQHQAEVMRIIASCPENVQNLVHYIGEQLLVSEDKIGVLAKHARKIRELVRKDNPVELMAVADYFGYLIGEEIIERAYSFADPLPVGLQPEVPDGYSFTRFESSIVNEVFVAAISIAPAFVINEEELTATFRNCPALYLHVFPVVNGEVDGTAILLPLEEMRGNAYIELETPSNYEAETIIFSLAGELGADLV